MEYLKWYPLVSIRKCSQVAYNLLVSSELRHWGAHTDTSSHMLLHWTQINNVLWRIYMYTTECQSHKQLHVYYVIWFRNGRRQPFSLLICTRRLIQYANKCRQTKQIIMKLDSRKMSFANNNKKEAQRRTVTFRHSRCMKWQPETNKEA